MLEGFEDITGDLNDEEMKYLPYVLQGLSKKNGPDMAVKTVDICSGLNKLNEKKNFAACTMYPARLRKIINHIRTHQLLNFVIGTSTGYYITRDAGVVGVQIKSLEQRAGSIQLVADAMQKGLDDMLGRAQTKLDL